MRNGSTFARPTWARRTAAKGFGSSATESAGPLIASALPLRGLWPTATAQDASNSARHGYMLTGHSGTTLLDAARIHHSQTMRRGGTGGLVLNPLFVEALMGLPIGYTEPAPSETQLSLTMPR